jgi:hypothetical protein
MQEMPGKKPMVVICTYRVKRGKEAEFRKLLRKHWPTLNRLGLVAAAPKIILRGPLAEGTRDIVEVFGWKARGFEVAHKSPAVLAIWEPMEQLCEARGGRPAMEFPHFEPIAP